MSDTTGWTRETITTEQTGDIAFIYQKDNVSTRILTRRGQGKWWFYDSDLRLHVFNRLYLAQRAAHRHAEARP